MAESSKNVDSSPNDVVEEHQPTKSIEKGEIDVMETVEKNKFKTKAQKKKEKKKEKKMEKKKAKEMEMEKKKEKEKEKKKKKKKRKNEKAKEKREKEAKNDELDELLFLHIGSKLVYMSNLSPYLEKRDIKEFFKDAGEIEWVNILKIDGDLLEYGYVRFHTSEAADKALQLNGKELIDRRVELSKSINMDGENIFDTLTPTEKHKYLFIGNLSLFIKEQDIVEFFEDVGDVVSVHLIQDGTPLSGYGYHAHVEFPSSTIAHKAMQHQWKMFIGCNFSMFLATERTLWDYTSRAPGFSRFNYCSCRVTTP